MLSAASTFMCSHQLLPSNDDGCSWENTGTRKKAINMNNNDFFNVTPPQNNDTLANNLTAPSNVTQPRQPVVDYSLKFLV